MLIQCECGRWIDRAYRRCPECGEELDLENPEPMGGEEVTPEDLTGEVDVDELLEEITLENL